MGVCVGASCIGCPEWVISLAIIGGFVVYALIGTLIYYIVKAFKEDLELEYIILFIILWPVIIAAAIVAAAAYYVVRLIAMPIVGVEKCDLIDLERKVDNKIEKGDNKVMDYLKYEYKPSRKSKEAVKVKAKPRKKKK